MLKRCTLVLLILTQSTFAKEMSASDVKILGQLYLSHLIAYQPRAVGYLQFLKAFKFHNDIGIGKELFREATKVTSWPVIVRDGDGVKFIRSGGQTVATFEIEDFKRGLYRINQKSFVLDKTKPVVPQVVKLFRKNHKFSRLDWLEPQANAAERDFPDWAPGFGIILGTAMAASPGIPALYDAAAAVATPVGGAVAAGVLAALTLESIICSGHMLLSTLDYGPQDSAATRYLSCMSTPLSWVGLNPRDRLYLDEIECGSFADWDSKTKELEVTVELRSATGIRETRTFKIENDKLARVDSKFYSAGWQYQPSSQSSLFSADGLSFSRTEIKVGDNPYKKLERPGDGKILDEAQGLFANADSYRKICQDPKLLDTVNTRLRQGKQGDRAWDTMTPEDMSKSAH